MTKGVVAVGDVTDLYCIVVAVVAFKTYYTLIFYLCAGCERFEVVVKTGFESPSRRVGWKG
jgi:hypothetical protein